MVNALEMFAINGAEKDVFSTVAEMLTSPSLFRDDLASTSTESVSSSQTLNIPNLNDVELCFLTIYHNSRKCYLF